MKKTGTDIGDKQKSRVDTEKKQEHFIVAIGASAGGLEAIHDFFDNSKETKNVSYIIIQHLSPDYKSLLVELVAKHTSMKVFEAGDNVYVEPNCIYVIPPKKLMTIANGKLQLQEKNTDDKGPNTAIDTFLYTLAEDRAETAIAVILSGTGTDGTKGIEAIKESGGMVFVQEPGTAKFDGMPKSAIASGNADVILPPQQMPAEIYNHVQDVPPSIFSKGKVDTSLMDEIYMLVFDQTGCDFRHYKLPTILRRISRRMLQNGIKNIVDYISFMKSDPEECKALSKDFLIGVTKFFRDTEAYKILETKVVPSIVDAKENGEILKVWITACSTGEEAYSVAIVLNEYLRKVKKIVNLKIFATDIDATAIGNASKGEYPASIARDVPAELLERYFVKYPKRYQVIPEIRKQIVFAKHNIINDPPFIKNDLVTCRNMLIYMNNALQKKVLSTLHFSLNKGGYLFLGSSENISVSGESFVEVDRKWKIYLRDERPGGKSFSALENGNFLTSFKKSILPDETATQIKLPAKALAEDLKEVVTEDLGFAALYIDNNYEVKEAVGNFKKYLSLPEQTLNLNILKMVTPELGTALGMAIRRAWKENKKVTVDNAIIKEEKIVRSVTIVVKPAEVPVYPYTLVVMAENGSRERIVMDEKDISLDHDHQSYINDLKAELKETKFNLQAAVESLETANEELQSSNEELLSSNEELQSSNEELQSLNEELHTLNTEHQLKINELIELNDDLNNYFKSTDIGQVFLDRKLNVRKFNGAATKLINLIDLDIGRPFSNITTNIREEDLIADIEKVLKTGKNLECEVVLKNGRYNLMRIFPYVRQDKSVDGVVLTFVDITALKELNNIINGIFNASQNAIMAMKAIRDEHGRVIDFTWITANDASEKFYGRKKKEFIGQSLKKLYPGVVEKGLFAKYIKAMESDKPIYFEYPVKCDNKTAWWEAAVVRMMDGVTVTFTDITDKKDADERIKLSYNELIRTKEELKNLNIELESTVASRTRELATSEERFRLVSKATNDAIIDWDLIHNKGWLSESFHNSFGYSDQNDITRDFWLSRIHPDEKEQVKRGVNKAINNGSKQWNAEYRFLKEDGKYANILDRGYILHDEYGTPYRILNSMMDVTELKEAQDEVIANIEQRKFLAETMPLIVWTADTRGNVDSFNEQFTRYTGVGVQRGLGRGWTKFVEKASLVELTLLWKESKRKRADFSMELKLKNTLGEYRWHLLRARPKLDDENHVEMWVGTLTDINEQKAANELLERKVSERTEELQKINHALELSNHDLQQFASVASHDLKEPLRKIQMFGNILQEKYPLADGGKQYMERIISASARMTRLINDLLVFSRLSVNSLFQPVNLTEIVGEILQDLELVIEEKKAKIIFKKLLTIDAIPGQMRQLFQNIISNALKFSRENVMPEISITCHYVATKNIKAPEVEKGDFCKIIISDNGIGFDAQYSEKIFTIFQRLHTVQEYEGTGIGLAICKKIIEKHNGEIAATSEINKGSTFTIVLPIRQG